ncbi:MAG: metalloregulator ArsR/SmtB family transcription factor [Minisyncoccia bacterium]
MPLKSFCKAFGNPQRVRLIACLAREATVSNLLDKCDLSQSALSQHLAVLRRAGIVRTRESGRHVYYQTALREYVDLARKVLTLIK